MPRRKRPQDEQHGSESSTQESSCSRDNHGSGNSSIKHDDNALSSSSSTGSRPLRSTRKQEVVYDAKYHPMDDLLRPNSAAVRRQVAKKEEVVTSSPIKKRRFSTEDYVNDSTDASNSDDCSSWDPAFVSSGPRRPDANATRRSKRSQAKKFVDYSVRHHPQDYALPFHGNKRHVTVRSSCIDHKNVNKRRRIVSIQKERETAAPTPIDLNIEISDSDAVSDLNDDAPQQICDEMIDSRHTNDAGGVGTLDPEGFAVAKEQAEQNVTSESSACSADRITAPLADTWVDAELFEYLEDSFAGQNLILEGHSEAQDQLEYEEADDVEPSRHGGIHVSDNSEALSTVQSYMHAVAEDAHSSSLITDPDTSPGGQSSVDVPIFHMSSSTFRTVLEDDSPGEPLVQAIRTTELEAFLPGVTSSAFLEQNVNCGTFRAFPSAWTAVNSSYQGL